MKLSRSDIAHMIDLSAVKANDGEKAIKELADCARQYGCYLVTTLPSQIPLIQDLLEGDKSIKVGGNVGFPSGGQTTTIKAAETHELVKMGVNEIDMVINIGWLISRCNDPVYDDIRAVVDAASGLPVKVILECHYLTNEQILEGCDLSIKAGAAYVKTGTGWTPTGATLENIALIKNHVGDAIRIKASGGIRNLETLVKMYRLGANRFGIGIRRVPKILGEITDNPDGGIVV